MSKGLPFIRIIKPGFLTTIQDRGRFHYQKWGVPTAGAMDVYALRVGNMLVGNDESEGCLEITIQGPVIEFLEPGLVALTGADLGASLNEKGREPWESFRVKKGDYLRFTGVKNGCRAYLAVAGGLDVPTVMGSKSTYLRGQVGGIDGRALCAGDVLGIKLRGKCDAMPKAIPAEYRNIQVNPQIIRVVLGPQEDAFTEEGIKTFLQSEYKVTNESDRMGCRLEGPRIQYGSDPGIISDGIAMGSVQVPGNGSPIVLMADRQTTGGYAKIATVITPDLWKIAQAKTGDSIRFSSISLARANAVYREYENMIRLLPERFIPLEETGKERLFLIKLAGKEYRVEIREMT